MSRQPRIDAPGMIHHVFARGIERRNIFIDDGDAEAFLMRLQKLVADSDVEIFAFALVSNHFHLLVRRHNTPLSTFMQRLLTSYALYFNKKYGRVGHLFQNRYKTMLCRSDVHFLELIRYIHLNPLRAGLVSSFEDLGKYPYASHSMLLAGGRNAWIDPGRVLSHFGSNVTDARRAYIDFLIAGLQEEPSVSFDSCEFAGSEQLEPPLTVPPAAGKDLEMDLEMLLLAICTEHALSRSKLLSPIRKRNVTRARSLLAFRISREIGLSGSEIGRLLSVTRSTASKMISKGSAIEGAYIQETEETCVPNSGGNKETTETYVPKGEVPQIREKSAVYASKTETWKRTSPLVDPLVDDLYAPVVHALARA